MSRLRHLVAVSRPISWVNTALPFLAAGFDASRELTPVLLLGTLAFLVPYNLLLYGVNDVYDYASDVGNPRKGTREGALVSPHQARTTLLAIAAVNLPVFGLLAWLAGAVAAVAIALTLVAAWIYSAPPLRTKERPVLDSLTSALHFVLPAVCGALVAGTAVEQLPWPMLAAFLAWGMASHALGAIQDIEADRSAGIGSIATALGARRTAVIAVIGYATAVSLVGASGGAGVVAATVLSTYLLLPLAVLASREDSVHAAAAARRAWHGFLGLNYLAGFALTQILLWHWGVTAGDPWLIASAAASAAVAIALAQTLATRVWTRRRTRANRLPTTEPGEGVTVVVPCRNEADRLPETLAALAGSDWPGLRVVVVDDGSTDGSGRVAREILRPFGARARVMAVEPRPDGWTGKAWACHTGARVATTELVLFLDADTVLHRAALPTLVTELRTRDVGLLSGVTRYDTPSLGERVAVPGLPMLLFGFVPVWLAARTRGRLGPFAYGPLMLVRREAYRASGGHAAAPGSAREDLDLAGTMARHRGGVAIVHAADVATTRHYPTVSAAVAAWRRILLPYAGGSLAVAIAAIAGQALALAAPVMLPLAALASGQPIPTIGTTLIPFALLIAFRVALTVTQGVASSSILLHPLTVALTLASQAMAIVDWVRGRPLTWRGRDLPNRVDPGAAPATASPASIEVVR